MRQSWGQHFGVHVNPFSLEYGLAVLFAISFFSAAIRADEPARPPKEWKVMHDTGQRLEYMLQCMGKRMTDDASQCPSIVVKHKKTSEKYNHAYLDVIISDYTLSLEKTTHGVVNFSIVTLGKVDTIHVTAQQHDKQFDAIIAVTAKDIFYYEYIAGNDDFIRHKPIFNQYWESHVAQLK